MRNFTPAEERAENERLARLICRAINGGDFDCDRLVARGQQERFLDGYAIDFEGAQPAWVRYAFAAKVVFDDARRQEELAEGAANET